MGIIEYRLIEFFDFLQFSECYVIHMKCRALCILGVLLLGGCSGCSSPNEQTKQHAIISERLPLTIAGVPVSAQIAITQAEQHRGLMFRKNLPEGEGMIFVYKEPQRMSYWMNNVPIALSIGFFDREGVLQEVRRMLPRDTRTVPSASDQIQYALEMSDGWFTRNGVRPGAKMDMKLLAAALKARGEYPKDYGIK